MDRPSRELDRANETFGEMLRRGRSYSGNERNCCFLNTSAASAERNSDSVARFANISATSGIDLPDDGRALVATDWDHDGDLDLWISNRNAPRLRFFRNDTPSNHHHLALRLEGNQKTTNRDAIGARVEVMLAQPNTSDSPPLPLIRTLRSGESFLSQSSKWLHFGLGEAEKIEMVRVRWPGGDWETFVGLDADRRYRIVQGHGEAIALPRQERVVAISPTPVTLPAADNLARIPFAISLPMAELRYQPIEGGHRELPIGGGKPVLLNLWASWCQPCVSELQEMREREREIRDLEIDVVALSVDGLGDDRGDASAAVKLIKQLGFPFTAGLASEQLVAYLQNIHDHLIVRSEPLPVPVSFLIDEEGRIAVVYKGRLNIDSLAADLKHSRGTLEERFARAAPIAGRTLPMTAVSRRRNQFEARFRFATLLQQAGLTVLAKQENEALVELFPESAAAHNNLGISYVRQQRFGLAQASFLESIRIQPDFDRARANLGLLLAEHGRLEEATQQFERAVKSNPSDAKHLEMLGWLMLELKRWQEGRTHLERSLELDPNSANTHAHLGRVLAEQGELARAVVHLERAIAIQPNHINAMQNLEVVKRWIDEGK